jgi:transposase
MPPAMKKVMKKGKRKTFRHFTKADLSLMAKWVKQGKQPSEIATLLDRDLSSVCRRIESLKTGEVSGPVGRPKSLTPEQIERLVTLANQMIETADCEYQVTASMLKTALKLKCCDRVILEALHEEGVWFHPFREKPLLTEDDIKQRMKFGKDHADKPDSFWQKTVKGYLDEKHFTPYLTPAARSYARKRTARGAFRGKKKGLNKGYVKPKKSLKRNCGKMVTMAVAISAEKVLACYEVKGNWCGAAAEEFYTKHLGPALRKSCPSQKKEFLVVEDNDPTGHKCYAGEAGKAAAKITCLNFPKHSPDLMPLDYGFWAEVNKRLRAQEINFAADYHEKRTDFVARLRRTILRVPKSFLMKLVGAMKKRCQLVKKAKGGHFEEGS